MHAWDVLEITSDKIYLKKWVQVRVLEAKNPNYVWRTWYISKKYVRPIEGFAYNYVPPVTENTTESAVDLNPNEEDLIFNSAWSETWSTDNTWFDSIFNWLEEDTSTWTDNTTEEEELDISKIFGDLWDEGNSSNQDNSNSSDDTSYNNDWWNSDEDYYQYNTDSEWNSYQDLSDNWTTTNDPTATEEEIDFAQLFTF